MTAKRISVGLHGATWIALAVALAGALSTPQDYCYYEGESLPAPEIVAIVGLVAALLLQVTAVFITAGRNSSLRKTMFSLASVLAVTLAAVWIGALLHEHVRSWGCG